MSNAKNKGKKNKIVDGFYKGYDIKWLEKHPEHPDYHLVAEAKR